MQTTAERVAEITETSNNVPDPLHDVTDTDKCEQLVMGMKEHGWVGPPIVILSEVKALTGSHRIAAAIKAEVEIPQVLVSDLCETYGIDWAQHLADWEEQLPGPYAQPWYDAAAELRHMLPADVVDYLGYDVDGA